MHTWTMLEICLQPHFPTTSLQQFVTKCKMQYFLNVDFKIGLACVSRCRHSFCLFRFMQMPPPPHTHRHTLYINAYEYLLSLKKVLGVIHCSNRKKIIIFPFFSPLSLTPSCPCIVIVHTEQGLVPSGNVWFVLLFSSLGAHKLTHAHKEQHTKNQFLCFS